MAIQRDGRIVAAGFTDYGRRETIARSLPTGHPDPSFGAAGYVTTPLAGSLQGADRPGNDVTMLLDGRIAVAGDIWSGPPHVRVAVVTPGGAPDPSFDGDDGVVELALGDPQALDQGGILAPTRTGAIIVAGTDRVAGLDGTMEVLAVRSVAPVPS